MVRRGAAVVVRRLRFDALTLLFVYHHFMRQTIGVLACSISSLCLSCGSDAPSIVDDVTVNAPSVPEKRCGESREKIFAAYSVEQLAEFADCTVLVGHFQEDSVGELQDFAALKNVKKIEGVMNVFRSPGFVTLHGLENLEVVDGSLYIHLNWNLESISALAKLHTVTENLHITGNNVLPQAEVEWLGARVTVGGTKTLE